MPVKLAENQYGKSRVRLLKVERHGARHDLNDLNVDIRLMGELAAAYQDGDNRLVLPTDTMKNTVYVLARREPLGEIEEFGLRLATHFLARHPPVSRVRIAISQNIWQRIEAYGRAHDHAFLHGGGERRTALILQDRAGLQVRAGIRDLLVLKTAGSAFEGFRRDEYTTLREARDRVFKTAIEAEWTYRGAAHSYGTLWRAVREMVLEVFASHDSRSVQHTLYAIGEMVLERIDEITEIRLAMPNRHCLLADLSPFDLQNPNEVFVPVEEPYGIIEATLQRK